MSYLPFVFAFLAAVLPPLPRPSGPHTVGVRRYVLTDTARLELDPARGQQFRRLLVRVWYPGASAGRRADYVPMLSAYHNAGLLNAQSVELYDRVQLDAYDSSPFASKQGGWPLIFFSGGNGEREYIYSALMTELASHGYIVAHVVHPGVSDVVFSEGDVIRRYRRLFDPKPENWNPQLPASATIAFSRAVYDTFYTEASAYLLRDVSFVIDRLTRHELAAHVDTMRIATAGHSYGALAAAEACGRDQRVRACFLFDGAAFGRLRDEGLDRPMMMFRPAFVNDSFPNGVSQQQLFGSMRADGYEVNIVGAEHRSFMDAQFLRPSQRTATLTPDRVHAIVSAYTRAFLAAHLHAEPSPLLVAQSPQFPEVRMRVIKSYLPKAR